MGYMTAVVDVDETQVDAEDNIKQPGTQYKAARAEELRTYSRVWGQTMNGMELASGQRNGATTFMKQS